MAAPPDDRVQGRDGPCFVHPERGTVYRYETFSEALKAAYMAAGMVHPEGMRPFHDLG